LVVGKNTLDEARNVGEQHRRRNRKKTD